MPAGLTLLPSIKSRTWNEGSLPDGWVALERYQSIGSNAPFEVVVASAPKRPIATELRAVWRRRHGGRATDVLLVVRYSHGLTEHAAVVGVADTSLQDGVSLSAVATSCTEALAATTATAVRNAVAPLFVDASDAPPGLRNEGLFATYALDTFRTRHEEAWDAAATKASSVRDRRGTDLLRDLGWQVVVHGDAHILREDGHSRAVAVVLQGDEVFDRASPRFGLEASPVEYALAAAARQEVPWVQAIQGRRIRLYPARADLSIRRTGLTSFVEIDLAHLPDDHLAYVVLLLSPEALRPGGTAFAILDDSKTRASALGARLRDRVYRDVIPKLAAIVARKATPDSEALTKRDLDDAYHRTLVILFRTLFIAYAEDRELLPYSGVSATGYNRVSLKNRAREWTAHKPSFDSTATDLWDDLAQIWHAVFHGSTDWGVPQYGGGLFDDSTASGQQVATLRLTNAEIGPALESLLIDADRDEVRGPVDFSTLSVREFGTIYEGLLESSLSVAPTDLALNKDQTYVPTTPGAEVQVRGGTVYFHNASGARKATGSYFTKEFAVEHLLASTLEPALDEHLSRVLALIKSEKSADAAALFFDFRVADISMGSGHFLVGAVDHIATKMSLFLIDNPIDGVTTEIRELYAAAETALEKVGRTAHLATLTPESLIRRQVARRCIYGVDVNEIAVDLARLGLWIHTFVPGLPMSALDHGLVWGNSLTGIGTTEELFELLEPDAKGSLGIQSLFRDEIESALADGARAMVRASVLAEATVAESVTAAEIRATGDEALARVNSVFNSALASRLGIVDLRMLTAMGTDAVAAAGERPAVRTLIDDFHPVHFPIAYPEVFSRPDSGFDVVIGNPPWEEVTVEEDKFWGAHDPGLRSASSADSAERIERLRASRPDLVAQLNHEIQTSAALRTYLLKGQYPGMEVGDPDLYKAFIWQFWRLTRNSGRVGIVTPRSVYAAKGSSRWRTEFLTRGTASIIFAVNRNEWLFTDVNPGWPVALTSAQRSTPTARLFVAGPAHDHAEFAQAVTSPTELDLTQLIENDPLLCIPSVASTQALELFSLLILHPPLGGKRSDFTVKPGTELHATHDGRDRFFTNDSTDFPVHNHLNIGHFTFTPAAGVFNHVKHIDVIEELQRRRLSTFTRATSPFFGISDVEANDLSTLPPLRTRIAIRDVVHAGNPRKSWAALVPANTILTNKAPYLVFNRGDIQAQAYLLGILNSSTCDWFAHLRVGLNMNFFIFNSIPIPFFNQNDPRAQRLAALAGALALIPDHDFGDWARFDLNLTGEPERREAFAELDALATLVYQVPDTLLSEIFSTGDRPARADILKYREQWSDPR